MFIRVAFMTGALWAQRGWTGLVRKALNERRGWYEGDHEQIFSVLQCLDICLRTTHCFSVDINLDHPRKICRINPLFETRKHFLVKDENWKHVNISAKHLRKVCPFTLIVISVQCISLRFQKNGIFQILFRKTFLPGYSWKKKHWDI